MMSQQQSEAADSLRGKILVVYRVDWESRIQTYKTLRDDFGARLIMIHTKKIRPEFAAFAEKLLIVPDTNDVDFVEKQLRRMLQEKPFHRQDGTPDGLLAFDDFGVSSCARLCQRFGKRPQPFSSQQIQTVMNKDAFRKWCENNEIPSPAWALLNRRSKESARAQLENIRNEKRSTKEEGRSFLEFPLVMKLSSGVDKMQTRLVRNAQELDAHAKSTWRFISKNFDREEVCCNNNTSSEATKYLLSHQLLEVSAASSSSSSATTSVAPEILVEEFIGGQEVDIDCIIEDGEIVFCAISDNNSSSSSSSCTFEENGGMCPTLLNESAQESLVKLLEKFLEQEAKQQQKVHGCLHFEAKFDPSRSSSFPIEVNARLGGCYTENRHKTVFGVDLGVCVARLACGLNAFEGNKIPPRDPKTKLTKQLLLSPPCWVASFHLRPVFPNTSNCVGSDKYGGILRECKILSQQKRTTIPLNENEQEGEEEEEAQRNPSSSLLVALDTGVLNETYRVPPFQDGCVCWGLVRGNSPSEAKVNCQRVAENVFMRFDPLEIEEEDDDDDENEGKGERKNYDVESMMERRDSSK